MSNRFVFGRREFLAGSSAFIVAAALTPRMVGEGVWAPKRLAIGFVPADGNYVVDASMLSSGDGGFVSHGAKVTLSGVTGDVPVRERRGVEILAHYSFYEGSERKSTPFRAWAGGRKSHSRGSDVVFTMPLDDDQKLSFTLGALNTAASEAAAEALPVTLSVRGETGTLKIARGSYVIVPLGDNESEPRWSAWTLQSVDGRATLADADAKPAPFEHYVLKLDYAKA